MFCVHIFCLKSQFKNEYIKTIIIIISAEYKHRFFKLINFYYFGAAEVFDGTVCEVVDSVAQGLSGQNITVRGLRNSEPPLPDAWW